MERSGSLTVEESLEESSVSPNPKRRRSLGENLVKFVLRPITRQLSLVPVNNQISESKTRDLPIVLVTVPHEEDEYLNIERDGWDKTYSNYKFSTRESMNAREDKLARRYEKAAAELKYNPINPRPPCNHEKKTVLDRVLKSRRKAKMKMERAAMRKKKNEALSQSNSGV
ncbi:uncharacterized protein LOC111705026 [Eurytemora carolleeae]|uniref:uncharacterized protein LOC111705026 n=1 Tax=Eurytemora carolleeae TaxID=1294199 RepID=UPI000C75F060|nr:uncharacterized protein LOC111705026 [Eurytemora carolleeae]|eukprot:XP_023333222.1 uncharacterized protein LOC111705026 [Eurytemora affinis]